MVKIDLLPVALFKTTGSRIFLQMSKTTFEKTSYRKKSLVFIFKKNPPLKVLVV